MKSNRSKKMKQKKPKSAMKNQLQNRLEHLEPRLLLSGDGLINEPQVVIRNGIFADTTVQSVSTFSNTNDSAASQNAANGWEVASDHKFLGSFYTENDAEHMIRVDMSNAIGGPGIGWDLLRINGTLNLAATPGTGEDALTRETRYTIRLDSTADAVPNFNADSSYKWEIVRANNVIDNFDPKKFNIDTVDFKPARAANGNLNSLLKGKFTLELSDDRKSILLVYIGGITTNHITTANTTLAGGTDLLWKINDIENGQKSIEYYNGDETEVFGQDIYKFDGNLSINATETNKIKVTLYPLASSKNCITVAGAGLPGSVHNFDYSKSYSWTLLEVADGKAISGFSADKFEIDGTRLGVDSVNYPHFSGSFTVRQDGTKIIVDYAPPSNTPVANENYYAMKTGDIERIDLKEVFGSAARNFAISTGVVDATTGIVSLDKKWSAIKHDANFSSEGNGVFYFAPYINGESLLPTDQLADRGFVGETFVNVSAEVGGATVTKVLRFRVDAGLNPLFLEADVGIPKNNQDVTNGKLNRKIDVIAVQQRLRYLGIPVRSPGILPVFTDNASPKQMNSTYWDDYTSIDVDGNSNVTVVVGGESKPSKFFQSISLFNAVVADRSRDTKLLSVDNELNGVVKVKSYSLFKDEFSGVLSNSAVQWLSSRNAPFWIEFVDEDPTFSPSVNGIISNAPNLHPTEASYGKNVESVEWRGDWSISPNSSGIVQIERWGTSWAINSMLWIGRELDYGLKLNGLSLKAGGQSTPHKGHNLGTGIDIKNWADTANISNSNIKSSDWQNDGHVIDFIGRYATNINYENGNGWDQSHYKNGLRTNVKPHKNHYHLDIRRPIISDLHLQTSTQSAAEVNLTKWTGQGKTGADEFTVVEFVNGAYQPRATDVNGFITLASGSKLFVESAAAFKASGRFVYLPAGNVEESVVIKIFDKDNFAELSHQNPGNFTFYTTITFHPANIFIPPALTGSVGKDVIKNVNGTNNKMDVLQVQYRLNKLGYRGADGSELKVNGIWDSDLVVGIRQFQRAVGMKTADGLISAKESKTNTYAYLSWENAPRWQDNSLDTRIDFKEFDTEYLMFKELFRNIVQEESNTIKYSWSEWAAKEIFKYRQIDSTFGARTNVELAHFLANTAHETGRFESLAEYNSQISTSAQKNYYNNT